jgi:hypothetical protein
MFQSCKTGKTGTHHEGTKNTTGWHIYTPKLRAAIFSTARRPPEKEICSRQVALLCTAAPLRRQHVAVAPAPLAAHTVHTPEQQAHPDGYPLYEIFEQKALRE